MTLLCDLTWQDRLDARTTAALGAVLSAWKGSVWKKQERNRGLYCDCVNLVAGVYEDMLGLALNGIQFDELPRGYGQTRDRSAFPIIREWVREFDQQVVRDGTVEPGDNIVTTSNRHGLGPGHLLVASDVERMYFDVRSSRPADYLSPVQQVRVLRVFRPNKEKWKSL